MCSQWSREDHPSKYLTLQAASRYELRESVYLVTLLSFPPVDSAGTVAGGGGEPKPSPPLHKASGSPSSQRGSTRALPARNLAISILGEMAGTCPFKWRLPILCKLPSPLSLDVAQLWGSPWPNLPAQGLGPLESRLPLGEPGG